MPSPIPNALYGDVNRPNGATQTGCVHCLQGGVHAPQEIIYYYGGFSLCMTHVQNALQSQQNAPNAS